MIVVAILVSLVALALFGTVLIWAARRRERKMRGRRVVRDVGDVLEEEKFGRTYVRNWFQNS